MSLLQFAASMAREDFQPPVSCACVTKPSAAALFASAVRDLDTAVPHLVIAANEAVSRAELEQQREVVRTFLVQLNAVVTVQTDLLCEKFPRFSEGVVDGEA